MNDEAQVPAVSAAADQHLPARGPQLALNSKGQPAHRFEVKARPGPNGFLWWIIGLRYPVERIVRDEPQSTMTHGPNPGPTRVEVFGKPTRWRVAGPFISRAVAESYIAPSARR